MRITGLLFAGILLLLPLWHFGPLYVTKDFGAVTSQYLGFVSLIAMAQICILATRWPGLELVFGGLDRIYVLHKWLGITAVITALLHEAVDPEINGLEFGTRFEGLAEDVGEWAYNGLLIFVTVTLITLIPYNWWRQSHRLMGAVFALAAFHTWFIEKSFSNDSAMGIYVLMLSALGIIAYGYTLLPHRLLGCKHGYEVSNVEEQGDAIAINIRPVGGGIKHKAGQFAFAQFEGTAHKEIHPFTISCGPNSERHLQFTIKPLGDGTLKLAEQIETGQKVSVSRAFGHFRLRNLGRTQIWIAAGIGVTPFRAWLDELSENHDEVHMFACCRTREDLAHAEAFEERAREDKKFHFHLFESAVSRRLSAQAIAATVPDLERTDVFFCGPEAMRESLWKNLMVLALRRNRYHYEEFRIRSGLPTDWVWAARTWLDKRFQDRRFRQKAAKTDQGI